MQSQVQLVSLSVAEAGLQLGLALLQGRFDLIRKIDGDEKTGHGLSSLTQCYQQPVLFAKRT